MKANQRAVSTHFYNLMTKRFPALRTNPAYAVLFGWLAWGTWRDQLSGRLVLTSSVLANIEGKIAQHRNRNYHAEKFLIQFCADTGMSIEWSKWSSQAGLSRVLTKIVLPPDLRDAIFEEQHAMWRRYDLVCLRDGTKWNAAKQRAWREADRTQALEKLAAVNCSDALALGEYLNTAPPNRFTALLSNLPNAEVAARALQNPRAVQQQLSTLLAIRDQPQPLYVPSSRGRTVRLFGYNEGLLSLTKTVRQALAPDWLTADLQSAQLAIVAKQWKIPFIQEFLKDYQGSIWDYLFADLGMERTDERKRAIKDAIYAALYGRTPGFTAYMLSRSLAMQGIGARFLRIRLVEELFTARDRMFARVEGARGAYDVYGRWVALMNAPEVPKHERVDEASVLSQLAQAMEMRLLSPVIQSAIEQRSNPHGWSLLLWKHDGFNWMAHKVEDEPRWADRLQRMVQAQAEQHDILTKLIVE